MKVEDCKYFAIINKETATLLLDDSAYTVSVDKPEYHNIKYKGMNLTYIGAYIPYFHQEHLRTMIFGPNSHDLIELFMEEN